MWPAVLGLALAMILVVLIQPLPNSLSYASGAVVIIGLLGWIFEARAVAGPPPAVEPEHEEEEEAPGPSYWPIVLALGIVGIAAGLIYTGDFAGISNFWDYGALIVAVPLAAASAAGWANAIKQEQEAIAAAAPAEEYLGPPLIMSGGRMLMPVQPNVLVAQAAGGAAIALERVPTREISRRSLLRVTFWAGLGGGLLAMAAAIVDFMYPRGITGFGSVVSAGTVDQYPPGSKTQNYEGHFWLVNLTQEQGGPGFLALWWKCPHLGCTVPWRDNFAFVDPRTGENKVGWFRCPCHGSTYTDAGVRVFGPAPRSMDHMALTIADGKISVNTGAITKGSTDNPSFVVKA
jgi:cytochrome b6-f complex iron-sulfur subunit